MPEEEKSDRRTERMSGCAALGKGILRILTLLAFAAIAILLVLPLIPFHCSWGPRQSRFEKVKTQHQMQNLAQGLNYFYTEYNKLPLRSDSDSDLSTTTSAPLLLPLLGQDRTTNPRNIKFVDFPMARDGRFGLTDNPLNLVDSWGQPYHIILDTNGDNRITDPEIGSNPRANEYVIGRAIIYSSGPDRDPKTWKDNITTWR